MEWNGMKWNEMDGVKKTRQQRGSARQSIHQSELHTVRHERQPRHWWMEDRWSEKWLWLRYIDMRWNDDDDDEHKSQAYFHLFASQETHCIERLSGLTCRRWERDAFRQLDRTDSMSSRRRFHRINDPLIHIPWRIHGAAKNMVCHGSHTFTIDIPPLC